MFGTLGFDLRRSFRPALTITGIALALFILVGGGAVGVVYFLTERARPKTPLSDAIPVSQLTSGMLQAFECVRVGSKQCEQYDQATEYLAAATPGPGLVYTPYADDDPGRPAKHGTRTVVLDKLSAKNWKAVATAVTRNGRATDATVPPSAVQLQNVDIANYSVPGTDDAPAVTGKMIFGLADGRIELRSVTYG
jgi:hypothetical protein